MEKWRDSTSGFGNWAIVEKESGRVVGAVILQPLPGHPEIEVGWHLARRAWGKGYATESARLGVDYGFETLGLNRIVAVINPANHRSLAVAERLGMTQIQVSRVLAGIIARFRRQFALAN